MTWTGIFQKINSSANTHTKKYLVSPASIIEDMSNAIKNYKNALD